jgi:DNA invertase Pin-like site-specific DNA recombinase
MLQAMLEFAREADIIVVHNMDLLAKNLDDLRHLVKDLTTKVFKIQLFEGKTNLHP